MAKAETDIPRSNYRLSTTGGYYAAFIALGLAAAVLGPTLPGLAAHTRSGLAEISSLFMARSLGYLLGSGLGGRLYDRLPGHLLMAGMLGVMALTLALAPLIPWLWVLFGAMFVLGLGEGSVDVGGNTLLVWLHGKGVSPFMNGLHFFFGLGAFIAPVIIAQALARSGDIYWGYWTLAILILPVIFWLARLPSPATDAHSEKALPVKKDPWMVILVALFFFFYVGAEISFGGWIYSYATALNLSTPTMAAYLTSAFWGALTAGRLLSVPLATRLKPVPTLVIDLAGCLASVGLILLFQSSPLVIWIGTIGTGFFMAAVFPTTLTLAGTRMTITGATTGWFFVGSSMGGVVLPRLIGQLFEAISPRMTMTAIMIDLLVMLGFFAALLLYHARPTEH
jgi:fucose permease